MFKPSVEKRQYYRILTGQLFDSYERKLVPNQAIIVDKQRGIILDVYDIDNIGNDHDNVDNENTEIDVIDLRHLVVLPGFVDTHVHLFLHPYSETSWTDQVTRESLVERTLRASTHAWKTLQAGFTTVRDLGTEGALDADIALRKCLAVDSRREPIIHGPRYYCANRAIVTTSSYGPRNELYPSCDGVEGITGAEVADGKDACIRAVRRQVGAGADWIKIYADYPVRSKMGDVSSSLSNNSIATFSNEELGAMIQTAHQLGVKVAAHVQNAEVVCSLINLGIDTIEHGRDMDSNAIQVLAKAADDVIWVPTLAAYYTLAEDPHASKDAQAKWQRSKESFIKAAVLHKEAGGERLENIACGGDTGVFAHGKNGLELMLMRALEAEWERVLAWATLGGWRCVRGMEWEGEAGMKRLAEVEKWAELTNAAMPSLERDVPFGAVKKGWAADIIALNGRVDGDFAEFSKAIMDIDFVMKGGRIYRQEGKPVVS